MQQARVFSVQQHWSKRLQKDFLAILRQRCTFIYGRFCYQRDAPWCSWLRHCATSLKVADSIPDGVNGIFRWHNLSGRTMALGSTQLLTEMNTGNISWGKGGRCVGLTLPPSCADCLEIWEPQPPGTLRACPGLQWDCFTFLLPVDSRNTSVLDSTDDLDMRFDSQQTLSMAPSVTTGFSPANLTSSNYDDSSQTDLHSNSDMLPSLTYSHN